MNLQHSQEKWRLSSGVSTYEQFQSSCFPHKENLQVNFDSRCRINYEQQQLNLPGECRYGHDNELIRGRLLWEYRWEAEQTSLHRHGVLPPCPTGGW